jgi:hypothetical protein
MNDRPTTEELIDAARLFLERELLPTLSDARLRFQTLVAVNCLAIAGRDLSDEEQRLREEWMSLTALLGEASPMPASLQELRQNVQRANDELCERIRSGAFDGPEAFERAAREVRLQVVRKLELANPKYLGGFTPR